VQAAPVDPVIVDANKPLPDDDFSDLHR
jgi:hypothetical protein